ncbi:hypothetical protein QTI66_01000 [Variovorax sp. J22R133]|uniref:hypothetical protein n=1 Tax=Variovorax brevis TaxID=3053503 RepID=UPI0025780A68|nr:hypothetical protein [Variovorax sp. J22R133]MDM0110703.1 hypothetical protein [Variovorax sp. J22R133]
MKRALDMAARLPLLYREGELVTGLLEQAGQQIEIAVDDALEVQRAHWFDNALELEEAAGLAALLDIAPEPWQDVRLFRAWVHAQRDALLKGGGVTADAITGFARDYAQAWQQATGLRLGAGEPVLIDNPPIARVARPPVPADDTVPLTQFSVQMAGLDETVASFLLTGLAAGPEYSPLVVNLSTGEALLYRGRVATGQRLWLRGSADRTLEARLENRDVSDRMVSISGLVPGVPWEAAQVTTPAQAIRLVHGENRLWFLPVAHFDDEGLDRVLLALADLALAQGRWDSTTFDHALFYQDAAVMLKVRWIEAQPATFELRLPATSLRQRVPAAANPEDARRQIGNALETGIGRLKAAGVRAQVRLLEFAEQQRSFDHLTQVLPLRIRDAGATGADRLAERGGLWGVTEYGESTFR